MPDSRPSRVAPRRRLRSVGRRCGGFCLEAVFWVVVTVLAVIVAGLAIVNFSPSYDAHFVSSESMAPNLNKGDMIVVGPANGVFSDGIKPGTVVTYHLGAILVSHRVQAISGANLITKGDAVATADPQPVPLSQVTGVVLLKIPKVGSLAAIIHSKSGWLLLIIVPALVALGLTVMQIIRIAVRRSRKRHGRAAGEAALDMRE